MPFAQGVETAKHFVEEAKKIDKNAAKSVTDDLDPQLEQEILECQDGEDLFHPDFSHLNPDELDFKNDLTQVKKSIRNIEIKTSDEILEESPNLDKFQKMVLHVAIKFAQHLRMSRKGKIASPEGPLMMVHGGAGSGKSTVINVISQYIHKILRKDGDDPDCHYVLLAAFTGSAASNISGQTLHTLFSFNFGAGYQSLNDQARGKKYAKSNKDWTRNPRRY